MCINNRMHSSGALRTTGMDIWANAIGTQWGTTAEYLELSHAGIRRLTGALQPGISYQPSPLKHLLDPCVAHGHVTNYAHQVQFAHTCGAE